MHAAGGLPGGAGGDEEHDAAGVRGTPQEVLYARVPQLYYNTVVCIDHPCLAAGHLN